MDEQDISRPSVYRPEDVMAILVCSITTARRIIAKLNRELKEQGYYTVEARVPINYFREKYHLEVLK